MKSKSKCAILALKTSAVANIWPIAEDYSETSVGINFIISEKRAGWSGCLWNRFLKTCGSWEPAWSVTKCWCLALSLYCHTKAIGGLDCSTLQVCSLIKSFDQFESDGCDNCETVLHLKNNRWKKKQRSSDIVNYFQGTTSKTALVPTSTGWSPAASQRIAGSQGQLTGAFSCYHSFADLIYFPGGRGSANLARYKTAH